MKNDTRYMLETMALVLHMNDAYQEAVKDEPQGEKFEIDRRVMARMVQMTLNQAASLNNHERNRLEDLVSRFASHYDKEHAKPTRHEDVQVPADDIDIPEKFTFRPQDTEKLRSIQFWGIYQQTSKTLAVRMPGPFKTVRSDGAEVCLDGWLALDSKGEPYAIPAEVMDETYANPNNEKIAGQCLFVDEEGNTIKFEG